uniref:Clathrin/coatomer adaptor adaptin-like N-terminal domain-containing protein n=1 Tax=Mola mola TaxID=94237 RepID=A0A3Q3WFS3_MOLML
DIQLCTVIFDVGLFCWSGQPHFVHACAVGITLSSVLRNEDLKEMLESNKESLKLEAMKRVVGLIAKGKNSSELFPAVVKNVASKNIEVRKLVYVYLVRYAEEQQDLALLSISTFQRALKGVAALVGSTDSCHHLIPEQ